MANIDIKLKSYDQLIFEITKLNTDIYLKNMEIARLNKIIDEALYYLEIDMIGTAIDKLKELKKEGKNKC